MSEDIFHAEGCSSLLVLTAVFKELQAYIVFPCDGIVVPINYEVSQAEGFLFAYVETGFFLIENEEMS